MSKNNSYGQILKSSSIIGGAQAINMVIGMIRTKFVAVLLGPAGVGLIGTYVAITGLVRCLSGLGINSSGVREVAEANGGGHAEQVGRTILTLRRMVWLTGAVGVLILGLFAVPISQFTFKDSSHAVPLMFLAVTLFFQAIQGGQMALIQGMRRIADLARINVIGSAVGTVISIGLYYWMGMDGIVPALISLAALNLGTSWWFARKMPVPKVTMTWRESFAQTGGLIKLGVAMMCSGLVVTFVAYLTLALISRDISIEAVGVFQAAFSLSGMFINFVLGAMGADFYPSLTAVSHDNKKVNSLVNEQTEIGLLLAVPGLIATIVLAPLVIWIFYTGAFTESVDLLRWFVFGCLGRVVSWPMGFIMLARGESRLFLITETMFGLIHAALIWIGLKFFGLMGVAIAFMTLYILYTAAMLAVSRHLTSFTWSRGVKALLFILLPASLFVFLTSLLLPVLPATAIGSVLWLLVGVYCLRQLAMRLGAEHRICRMVAKVPGGRRLIRV